MLTPHAPPCHGTARWRRRRAGAALLPAVLRAVVQRRPGAAGGDRRCRGAYAAGGAAGRARAAVFATGGGARLAVARTDAGRADDRGARCGRELYRGGCVPGDPVRRLWHLYAEQARQAQGAGERDPRSGAAGPAHLDRARRVRHLHQRAHRPAVRGAAPPDHPARRPDPRVPGPEAAVHAHCGELAAAQEAPRVPPVQGGQAWLGAGELPPWPPRRLDQVAV